MMIDQDNPVIEFTTADRCIRCGAQALVLARREETGTELEFCAHHIREHKNKLREDGFIFLADGVKSEEVGFDHETALV